MRTLGETLRQARLDLGVSLAEAEDATRIRRRHLEALEGEDWANLPPPVYTRGFVRTYAEYLGLNPAVMVDLYKPITRQTPVPTLRHAVPRIAIPREIPVRPLAYALAGLLLVVAVIYLWGQYQAAAAALRDQEGVARARTGTPTVPPRVPTPNPIAVASPPPTLTPTPEPSPSPTPVVDGILVEIRATQRVYVEASADGKQIFADTLEAGTARQLPLASDVVIVRASVGSAVEITLNGRRQDVASSQAPTEFTWRR
ncbi:MAG: DUF4115 domain-containing protein [Chloroflexi bacterium]|nr:DUF4115 domain-containing protein [Chloroflexota bacterium]